MGLLFFISRGAEGPGREILQRPPSVRLSVTFSFRTVTQKRIAVFSRYFAGTCTKSWGWFLQIVDIGHFIMRLEILKSAPSLTG